MTEENKQLQSGIEIVSPPNGEAVMMDVDSKEWHARIDELLDSGTTMITFRGAGTVNGIDPLAAEAAASLVNEKLAELIESGDPVALIYDGDEDDREKPDIGAVFGMVADNFKDAPNVTALTGQREDWYYPKVVGAKLESANGTPYETYVFPNEMPGAHKELTQSDKIVQSPNYRQIIVGPAGPIAESQLKDVSDRAVNRSPDLGPVKIDVIETRNNPALDAASNEAQMEQRRTYPRGALFTNEGQFKPTTESYPGLEFSVESLANLDSRTLEQRTETISHLGNTATKPV